MGNFLKGNSLVFILIFSFLFQPVEAENEKIDLTHYLLPNDHPIKPVLDSIFFSQRVIFNSQTLTQAGFAKAKPRHFTQLLVTKHPAVPGYIFKLYLDVQRLHKAKSELDLWILRIDGANSIRDSISKYGIDSLFKVPHKWIYALPSHLKPKQGYYPKNYILVEEDMNIYSTKENHRLWRSDVVTPFQLYFLYLIVKELGLNDTLKPDNIPFSKDGKIAFVDTQSHGASYVNYDFFKNFLSDNNILYWKMIINQ